MSLRNSTKEWGSAAKAFHWLSLLLLIAVWVAVLLHEAAPKDSAESLKYILLHKALGVSLLAFVLARLLWQTSNVTPKPLPAPVWQLKAASLVHSLLYVLLLAMPLSGMVMTQLAGRPISWFGLFDLPQLLTENKELAREIKEWHTDIFWPALLLLSLGHIVVAWFHQSVLKDNLIKRML